MKPNDWIKPLPPGIYTMKDLQKISGRSCHSSIKHRMIKYGAIVTTELGHHNLSRNIFEWNGYKEKEEKK